MIILCEVCLNPFFVRSSFQRERGATVIDDGGES